MINESTNLPMASKRTTTKNIDTYNTSYIIRWKWSNYRSIAMMKIYDISRPKLKNSLKNPKKYSNKTIQKV